MSVTDFPKVDIPSPLGAKRSGRDVIVDGRVIPGLSGAKVGDSYHITLDGRFGVELPEHLVHPVLSILANALAIGGGYSHAGAELHGRPFAPKIMNLSEIGPKQP